MKRMHCRKVEAPAHLLSAKHEVTSSKAFYRDVRGCWWFDGCLRWIETKACPGALRAALSIHA